MSADSGYGGMYGLPERPSWHAHAKCHGRTDLFFPTRGETRAWQAAQALCDLCPVSEQCAEAGMTEYHGIWGATSERQRRIRRRLRVVAA